MKAQACFDHRKSNKVITEHLKLTSILWFEGTEL